MLAQSTISRDPPVTPPTSQTPLIMAKLDDLSCDLRDMKASIKELSTSYGDFKVEYSRAHTELEVAVKNLAIVVAEHQAKLDALQKMVGPLLTQSRLLSTIGGTLLALVLALMWAILTHQIEMVPR